jgi:hypothetical protein
VGNVKPQRVRCQLVLDAVGKKLIRCKNPAKHRLPDGTPLCTVRWQMSEERKTAPMKLRLIQGGRIVR